VLASVLISYVLLWQNLYLNKHCIPLTKVPIGSTNYWRFPFQAPPRFVKGCKRLLILFRHNDYYPIAWSIQ